MSSLLNPAISFDIVRGCTFRQQLNWVWQQQITDPISRQKKLIEEPINLNGFDFEFQIRATAKSKKLYVRKHSNIKESDLSGIHLDRELGIITIVLSEHDTVKIKDNDSVCELRCYKPNGDIVSMFFADISMRNGVVSVAGVDNNV